MSETTQPKPNLSELITLFYEQFLALYGDEDLASVAAAAAVNDILSRPDSAQVEVID